MSSSAQPAPASGRPESFQIKGGLFPMNLLEVKTADLDAIRTELTDKIRKAPGFFQNAPLVLGFEMLDEALHADVDLPALITLCRSLELLPAATRGGNAQLQEQSVQAGLATIAKGREKHMSAASDRAVPDSASFAEATAPTQDKAEPAPAEPANPAEQPSPHGAKTRVVTTPIRSGQQVYAAGGDLIIMNSVSPGAEVLADGNIHIYGALRGRALAGIKGDENARIFCTSQEAELVAIAGHFMVDETLKATHWKESVTIHIADGNITIKPLP